MATKDKQTELSEYLKAYSTEAAKEVIKARISGKVFKMADFETIQLEPTKYVPELQRWKTAITKAIKGTGYDIAIKHVFAWGPEDELPDEKYADLPTNGVPSNKRQLIAMMKFGRLGVKYIKSTRKETSADAAFDEPIEYLSGGLHTTYATYMEEKALAATKEAVELVKLTLSAGLNNEMELPFIKGYFHDYKAVMQWIDRKTEMLDKKEHLYELFQKLDESLSGDAQIDTKCMQFRMALESIYIDKPIKFPDWEYGDPMAESLEKDVYAPPLSFIFLWESYKMVKKALGHQKWVEIEDEFKREIGAADYNKEGWMENKPKLYKIINKKMKTAPKAKLAPIAPPDNDEHLESDEETLIEMEDGCILQVKPKFRGADQAWKRNFTRKFNLQQSGNNRWAQRPNRQQFKNGGNGGNNNNNNQQNGQNQRNNRSNGPSAEQMWKCKLCINDGRGVKKFRGDQQCPKHKYRPKYFESIKLAGMRQIATEEDDENETNVDHHAQMNTINAIMFGNESD